nr:MAG TPA: hypothetical protein [Caudoviricetes sp.]
MWFFPGFLLLNLFISLTSLCLSEAVDLSSSFSYSLDTRHCHA